MVIHEPKTVVLGGNRFPFHRIERLGPVLERSLRDRGIDAEVTTDRDVLRAERIREYDAVVDITTDSTLNESQESGLRSFVESGGGTSVSTARRTSRPPPTNGSRRRSPGSASSSVGTFSATPNNLRSA
ncbi:ThuA domain-containing protein [Halostagnicola kamekurae]|uniref:ThuA domain-containing protein n=1 Tax=Halostagnicola kamekurae TaxID=619731 RepID=UPI001C31D658|nr:ThuA domain-containing protein [Halostagnicola kamekurae]